MAVLPETKIQQLEFCEVHNPIWTAQAVNIGLTTGAMTTLVSLTTAARSSYNAMLAAHEAARNATQQWYDNHAAMRDKAADYIKAIKGYSATTGNPAVYTLAQIPPPKAPAPTPPPATPTNLTVSLLNTGAVQLDWKASVALGTSFSIWRKFNAPGEPYLQIGLASSVTTFTDETLPVGASGNAGTGVFYQVQAHRLGLSSPASEPVLIRLGSVEGDSSDGESLKIAA